MIIEFNRIILTFVARAMDQTYLKTGEMNDRIQKIETLQLETI